MSWFAIQTILTLFGTFFLYTGFTSFYRPASFAKTLGLQTNGRSGTIEIRAQYGGFFFAAGLSQLAAILGCIPSKLALFTALVIFGGLILGRVAALLNNDEHQKLLPTIFALYFIDAGGAALAMIGFYLS